MPTPELLALIEPLKPEEPEEPAEELQLPPEPEPDPEPPRRPDLPSEEVVMKISNAAFPPRRTEDGKVIVVPQVRAEIVAEALQHDDPVAWLRHRFLSRLVQTFSAMDPS